MSSRSVSPGPESEPETPQHAETAPSSRRAPRSCHLCNRRKVRCDKKEPCSPCSRAGKTCVYPPPGRAPRRPKKAIMSDMALRISSLERSLAKAESTDSRLSNTPPRRTRRSESIETEGPRLREAATATPYSVADSRGPEKDILVQKGSSSQYFNEILLSRVIEEERDLQSALTTPNSSSAQPAVASPFNPLGILSAPSASHPPHSFHPPKPQALKLWSLYIENVESSTGLKILHIPTDEIKVYETIGGPSAAPLDNLALCFAIYYSAVITMADDREGEMIMGLSKTDGLARFKTGFEQALAHADFLDNPTITGMHSLAIYLGAHRVHNRGKGIWVLNGLAVRIAQSLGLHRDGERLGLTPFEAEIRRRLWWQFLTRDSRAGEDYGLQSMSNLSNVSDVGEPLNVEDADLHPDMKELPAPRIGWTPLTFSLINIDICKALQRLAAVASASTPSCPPREEVRAQIMAETRERVETRLEPCNIVIPRHRITILIARFILRKTDLITRQQWQLLRYPEQRESFATEENFVEALETLELGLVVGSDEMLKPWWWSQKAYPQYHMILYILWHLCVKPEGPNVERAWRGIEAVYPAELGEGVKSRAGAKPAVMSALKAKAESIREQIRAARAAAEARGSDVEPAPAVKESLPCEGVSWGYPLVAGAGAGDGFDFGMSVDEFPAWETLVQGAQFDGQNFPNVFWQ